MRLRKGITMAMLAVMVAVLGILTTVTVTSISNTYINSKLAIWTSEISVVQDLMKEKKDNLQIVLMDEITFDVSNISQTTLTEQFSGETIISNELTLKEINLAAIGVDNALYGVHKDKLDIYAYSELTGKVYYLKGFDARIKKYYTLTKELKNKYGDNLTVSELSLISFEQSEIEPTMNAVKVTVKVPKSYTSVSITTTNSSITIGSRVTETDKYTYLVNDNEIKGNYTITVTYTEGEITKNVKHLVDNYDGAAPIISGLIQSNLVYNETESGVEDYMINVTATDESDVVALKYTTGTIAKAEASTYFEKNGVNILKTGKIEFEENINDYTIYAKDKAGNEEVLNYTRPEMAYAIYSAPDSSFRFVSTPKAIKQAGMYKGKVITNLYSGFENIVYSEATAVPWYSIRANVTNVVFEDKITPTSTRNWFSKFTNCASFDVSKLDTSKTTDMAYMFDSAGDSIEVTKFRITGLENFDTSNVTVMHTMFNNVGRYATDWSIGDLSGFNTANVTRMDRMFRQAGRDAATFNIGNLDNWNIGKVRNIDAMFQQAGMNNATSWNIGKLTNWNTANITSFSNMFSGAAKKAITFDIGNIGGWNVSNVTDMSHLFSETATAATTVYVGDLSNWNMSKCTNMDYMFFWFGYSATTYNIGDIGKWDVSNVTTMNRVFRSGAHKAKTIVMPNFANWDTSKVTNMDKMFTAFGIGATWKLDLTPWNVWNVTTHIDFSAGTGTGKITEPYWVNTLGT